MGRHIRISRLALAAFLATASAAQAQSLVYDIPAGPLPQALTAFGLQSGLHVAYAPEAAEGLVSPGLRGQASPQEALARILGESGLQASFPDARSALIAAPAPAPAPIVAAPEVRPTPVFTLEPIILYGSRTARRLDEARTSVAVVQGDPLAAPAVASWRDGFRRMANVGAGDWAEDGFVIRGVNSEGLVPGGANAPLGTFYVDGVEQTLEGARRGTRGMFDVEQVEVYRGPQSTLSGRAALGGAVYLRTKDPEFARSGAAQLTFGEDQRRQIGLAYGDHVGERVAFRLSGEWSDKDSDLDYSDYERFSKYKDFASDDYYAFRGKLLIRPTGADDTRLLLSASHAYDSPDYNEIAGADWTTGAPGYGARRGDLFGPTLLPDLYRSFGLTELPVLQESRETKVDSFGLEATHDFSDSLRLTALTGFSRSTTERDSVNADTPGEFFQTQGEFTQSNLTQEVRLNGETGPLTWVAGLYAGRADNKGQREAVTPNPFLPPTFVLSEQTRNEADILNLAAFGEASYAIVPGLRAIAGGRVDHIRQEQTASAVQNGFTTADTRSEFRDTVFLPKLGLEYDLTDNQTLAFVYQHGYRPGGASIRASDGQVYDYDPETTRNYELSWRGRFLDGRLGLAANLFYQDWRDQQIEVFDSRSSSVIVNAGKSESYGGELEASLAATDKLELYASLGLLRTEFKDLNLQTWGVDYSGMPFPNAPKASLAAGFRWGGPEGPFAAGSAKTVSSSRARLEAPHFLTGEIAPPRKLEGRVTVDAELGYAWENLKLTAYATNLFDKEYFVYESAAPAGMATLGDRRELGLRLDYRF